MKKFCLVVALASALVGANAQAAYGDADPSYSAPPQTGCTAITSREDGGAYADQSPNNSPQLEQVVARLDSHGAFVRSWGNSGVAAYPTSDPSVMRQILRGKDGDLLAVDSSGITRIDASGHIDTAFGNGGRVALGPVLSAALQGDGKIAVLMLINGRYAFERLNARGFVDTSLGRSGAPLLVGPPADILTIVYGWALRGDGGVELGTRANLGYGTQPRLTVVDATFNEIDAGGRLVPQGIATWMEPQAKVDPAGGLLLGAFSGIVARFNADGTVDSSFGNGGGVTIPGTTVQFIDALWREPDGKWTVVSHGIENNGFFLIYHDGYFRANRLTERGQLDPTFTPARIGYFSLFVHAVDGSILAGCGLKRITTDAPSTEGTIVEYYHADLDHYFMTSSLNEIAGVDANPLGWLRTGETFGDWIPANLPGAAHVCRFYGDPVIGPNSHFYSGEDFECQGLIALDAATPRGVPAWHLEAKPFDIAIPASGTCPANLQPVYRVFNGPASNGHGPNHRYTTDPKVYAAMQAKGWLPEGVHFCAPPRTN